MNAQSWNVEVNQSDTNYTIVFSFNADGETEPTSFEWNPGDSVTVVYGPVKGSTTSVSYLNGKWSKSSETKYTVIACNRYPGTVTIPPACISFRGVKYYSEKKVISSNYFNSQVGLPAETSETPKKVSSSGKREDGAGQQFTIQWKPAIVKAITGWCYNTENDKWSGNANAIYYKKLANGPSIMSATCESLRLGEFVYCGEVYYILKWVDHWSGIYHMLVSAEKYEILKNAPAEGIATRLPYYLQINDASSSNKIVDGLCNKYPPSISVAIKKEDGVIRFQKGDEIWGKKDGQLEFPIESDRYKSQGYFEVSISEWKRLFQ